MYVCMCTVVDPRVTHLSLSLSLSLSFSLSLSPLPFRVDARNNSILEEKEEEEGVDVILQNGLGGGGKESHLMPYASQKKKVILHTSQGGSLGLSIRGGKEYDLGVYVSRYSPPLQSLITCCTLSCSSVTD